MTAPAISVRDLRKAYRLYAHPRDMLLEALTGRPRHSEFVALDGVSFEVAPGSVVGLMGRNGAGKSTLLRVIAGTLDASGGRLATRGRIAAILELGTGFHPDYTGRENVYLGGLCLGLGREEIDRRFDEIVAFSELEAFIDQPFRTYSSGMQARLTFSVATCVDPDILIVDEALSVGDAKFQLKSFDRIRDFKRRGKAILVVSHSINQIVAFCDRAILLEKGRVHAEGDPNKVGQIYHELLFGSDPAGTAPSRAAAEPGSEAADLLPARPGDDLPSERPASDVPTRSAREHRYGDGAAVVRDVRIIDNAGRRTRNLRSLECYTLAVTVRAIAPLTQWCLGMLVRDCRGLDLFGTDSLLGTGAALPRLSPGMELTLCIRFRANLAAGTYYLTLGVAHEDGTKHDMHFDAHEFTVDPTPGNYATSVVNLETSFEIRSPGKMAYSSLHPA